MGAAELAIRDLDFEASVSFDAGAELRLVGNGETAIVPQLNVLVATLHEQVVASNLRETTVDIRALEFMNATCFNVFVTWLGLINDLAIESRYQLRFLTNTAIPWQRRSLRTLSCFATDLVKLES